MNSMRVYVYNIKKGGDPIASQVVFWALLVFQGHLIGKGVVWLSLTSRTAGSRRQEETRPHRREKAGEKSQRESTG